MSHVQIGVCPACGQFLKAKEHAPRKQMHVTCHCGWHGTVQVDDVLVERATELRAQGAGRRHKKTRWQRFIKGLTSWWHHAAVKRTH